jgi:hypothetical protein
LEGITQLIFSEKYLKHRKRILDLSKFNFTHHEIIGK